MKLTPVFVEPEQLLLDPNNYRFHNLENFRRLINPHKYADPYVQSKTLSLIQSTPEFELQALKDSIATNGFVPLEQMVVEEYDNPNGSKRYLVVEGNRRTAAIKSLLEEVQSGSIDIADDNLQTLREFQVIEIEGTEEERTAFRQTLMAIRHVTGVREWGPYQQAKLIAELYEKVYQNLGSVARAIGLKAREVARRYRAIKALEQMENDEEYAEFASPKLYAFFDEALAAPVVRDWLGWSDVNYQVENTENKRSFYDLLIPRTVDDETYPPKLKDIRQVRKLKDIIGKPLAMSILLDPETNLEDAITVASAEGVDDTPRLLEYSINQAIQALKQPSIDSWFNPTDSEKQLWEKFVKLVDSIKSILH